MIKKGLIFAAFAAILIGCSNQPIEFEDYTETVYYPIQYPVRTLVLGESRIDNSIDLRKEFSIGVCVGGKYTNEKDITVKYKVDEGLLDGVTNVEAMPTAYYLIKNKGEVVIPKGDFNGNVIVKLTDAFFQDKEAHLGKYVIPLVIENVSSGEFLCGEVAEGISEPNPHVGSDWLVAPRHFTLFGVKYVNLFDGDFFRFGKTTKNGTDEKVYNEEILEHNPTINMVTTAEKQVSYVHTINSQSYNILVNYTTADKGCGDITFDTPEDATYTISGTGKFYDKTTDFAKEHGSWLTNPNEVGSEYPHLTLVLDYDLTIGADTYEYADTLVFRNNKVVYQEFTPVIAK